MILDLLISRYLDGELTPEEDVELRSKLHADPESREAFDQAILLHIAMRCADDDVDVPADVVEDTRALLFDKIDAAATPPRATVRPTSMARPVRRAAMLVAALLVLVANVGEVTRGLATLGSATSGDATLGSATEEAQGATLGSATLRSATRRLATSRDATLGSDGSGINDIHDVATNAIATNASATATASATPNERDASFAQLPLSVALLNPSSPVVTQKTPTLPSFASSDVASSDVASLDVASPLVASPDVALPSVALPSVASPDVAPSVASPDVALPSATTPLLLTTFYTSGMQNSMGVVSGLTQFSQSIGYGVSDDGYVGLEVGAMQYTVDRVVTAVVREGGTAGLTPTARIGGDGKVSSSNAPIGTFREVSAAVTQQEQVAWGAAFYQRRVIEVGNMSMQGRAGFGAAMDGVLAYGRLQAEYRIIPSISVTIGAEARHAPLRTGAISGQQSGQTYGTFMSVIYGLQVRL